MRTLSTATTVILLLISTITFSQNIRKVKWNNTPYKGFVFQITNKEAQKLLTLNTSDSIVTKMLHTQVDTFDTRVGWINRPAKGHFILAKIISNEIFCEYTSVFPYQVFLLKEYDALSLQVLDMEGNVREDAKVKFKLKKIHFDDTTKTYRLQNRWFYGNEKVVTVELDGFRSVFNIERERAPTWSDNRYYDDDDGPSFYSYMITDKNKYKPKEKVRFKSFALSHSRSPMHRDLQLWLISYDRRAYFRKKIGLFGPHRPGSYAGEFQLHDSLKMKLDQDYELQLTDKSGRVVAECRFKYEDYELNGNHLEVRLADGVQYHPAKNQLSITATDANGLMLKDARATIVVRTHDINEIFQPVAILKDTLLIKQLNLETNTATTFDIPSEIFQKTNTNYNVSVTILNAENQRLENVISSRHLYSQYQLRARLSADSIVYELIDNGKQVQNVAAQIRINDETTARNVILPFKEKLNALTQKVNLKTVRIENTIAIGSLIPQLDVRGGIKNDSLKLELYNPHKLETSWYVYRGSDLISRGSGIEMTLDSLVNDHSQTYYVELLYTFGGREQIKRRSYEFHDKYLDIELKIPERAFPGQTVDALVQVNNQSGSPVNNVDLTAFAVTSKLNYYVPDLPYYGNVSAARPQRDTYNKQDINKRSARLKLDYNRWVGKARLDTMLYYQLTYPKAEMFKHTFAITDSTQFAPYVMKDGEAQTIYVIEVNRVPVYYSWADTPNSYSFYAPANKKCHVTVRLFDRALIFDSLKFEAGKKTILSVDLDHLPSNIKTVKIDNRKKKKRKDYYMNWFTPTEIRRHTQYISRIQPSIGKSYLEAGRRFIPLFPTGSPDQIKIVGPVIPGKITFHDVWASVSTTYQHTGGFTYSFEDNIVYKLEAKNFIPDALRRTSYDPVTNVAQLVKLKDNFLASNFKRETWNTRIIDVSDPKIRLKVYLPEEKANSGFDTFLFQDTKTGALVSPCQVRSNTAQYSNVPHGLYNVIAIYNNKTYLKKDSINLQPYTKVVVDLNNAELHGADVLSYNWAKTSVDCYKERTVAKPIEQRTYEVQHQAVAGVGNIMGTVYASDNLPLPGCNIVIKGTTIGTVTDANGAFAIDANEVDVTLVFSFIGFITEEVDVQVGSNVMVTMQEDVKQLQEVVVVGYGTSERREFTAALSGRVAGLSISKPDVIEQPTPDSNADNEKREAEAELYRELLNLKTIRSNFTDVGFWEPKLYTDKKGQAKFSVTYPDDITQWNATVYGMNRYLQTGTARKKIKSYKPIMAQLAVPNFLTVGDSAILTGKILNYTESKNIAGKVKWSREGVDSEKPVNFSELQVDNYPVKVASSDSIKTSFVFTRDDGYMDGEERKVPIVEQGIIRADGTLAILNHNEHNKIEAGPNEIITVQILAEPIDIYRDEVDYLVRYRYACNEQLASKLIGLINYKRLCQFDGIEFRNDKDVNRIIERLLKNQNEEFLWSWWDLDPKTSYWMSSHILRALKTASDAGYQVNLDVANLGRKAEYKFEMMKYEYSFYDLELLNALAEWKVDLKYGRHVAKFDSIIWKQETYDRKHRIQSPSYLKEKLLLMEIRQLANVSFKPDSMQTFKRNGILGDVHFADGKRASYWYNDELTLNSIAYRIARRDPQLKTLIPQMQLYFLNQRNRRSWNTYESSSILTNVLPDLLANGNTRKTNSLVKVSGKIDQSINEFPYKTSLNPGEELTVTNQSGMPLYLINYKMERVTKAKTGVDGFEIKTSLANNTGLLEAGRPTKLTVEVNVKSDADLEYVMIEVPIPGSCSYGEKSQKNNGIETHREYFKERTVIFCENMKSGKYYFEVNLLPRFTGKYFVNPSQVSLMYVPVVNANTDMKRVVVR